MNTASEFAFTAHDLAGIGVAHREDRLEIVDLVAPDQLHVGGHAESPLLTEVAIALVATLVTPGRTSSRTNARTCAGSSNCTCSEGLSKYESVRRATHSPSRSARSGPTKRVNAGASSTAAFKSTTALSLEGELRRQDLLLVRYHEAQRGVRTEGLGPDQHHFGDRVLERVGATGRRGNSFAELADFTGQLNR